MPGASIPHGYTNCQEICGAALTIYVAQTAPFLGAYISLDDYYALRYEQSFATSLEHDG